MSFFSGLTCAFGTVAVSCLIPITCSEGDGRLSSIYLFLFYLCRPLLSISSSSVCVFLFCLSRPLLSIPSASICLYLFSLSLVFLSAPISGMYCSRPRFLFGVWMDLVPWEPLFHGRTPDACFSLALIHGILSTVSSFPSRRIRC